jgi:hypothetical protein
MSPKWVVALASIFVGITFVMALVERSYATTGATSYLETLMTFPNLISPSSVLSYFTALWGAITFNYPSIFNGGWIYLRYVLIAFGIGVGVSIIITILGLISNSIGGITSIFRR